MTRYQHLTLHLQNYEEGYHNSILIPKVIAYMRIYSDFLVVRDNDDEGLGKERLMHRVGLRNKCEISTVKRAIKFMEAPWRTVVRPSSES